MRRVVLLIVISLFAVLLPSMAAQAHVERPSYWPDPKPDCSVSPCAGGEVPTARSLASALDAAPPGKTLVVCQDDSMDRVNQSITAAKADGYFNRPSDHQALSDTEADQLLQINEELFTRCEYHEIQTAVTAAGNNDRVVVMPGLYTEPTARSQPTHDPACDQYEMPAESGDPGALSHDYQIHCPNDANLVAVIGRGPDTAPPPTPPKTNRHGIPNVGSCIRCNLQLEGSGVSADDVVVEAGDAGAGNGGPSAAGNKKDVGIFVDRADGFVLRNVTVRHAREHDIYILETDGYLFDRFKTFYAGAYGVLTFVEDHGVMQNCESAGNGDAGLYPGSGADSTDNRYKPFYPEYRFSQVVRWCDSHHNTGGFSGTDSHGTLITENNFYDNALGYTTDVFTAPGHPGFPQHGNVVEKNNFYDNNFNPYQAGHRRRPVHPGAGRHRHVDRRRQRQHRAEQPLLRQLATRRDALRGARRPRVRSSAARQQDAGARLQAVRGVDVVRQQVPPQPHGREPRRRGQAERRRLLVGLLPDQHGQLLVVEHSRPRQEDHQLAALPARMRRRASCRRPASASATCSTRPSSWPASPVSRSARTPRATTCCARGRRRRPSLAARVRL